MTPGRTSRPQLSDREVARRIAALVAAAKKKTAPEISRPGAAMTGGTSNARPVS